VSTLPHQIAHTLRVRAGELAQALVETHYAHEPELATRYGPAGRQRCLEDAGYHLRYLAEAVESCRPSLFADYVGWAKVVLKGRNIPFTDLQNNLRRLEEVLQSRLPQDMAERACRVVQTALTELIDAPAVVPSFLAPPQAATPLANEYLEALLAGQRHRARQLVLDAVDGGLDIRDVYLKVFQPVLLEVGRLWQMNEISVAHEHYCTAATQQIMTLLYPRIFQAPRVGRCLVSAAIGGDLHEIGSRMVADFFEMEGWDTYYLGANAPPADIARAARERQADAVGLSATIAYRLEQVRETIALIRQASRAKIIVGGRPFNREPDLWQAVGADGWANDAQQAVAVAQRLIETQPP
jgi:methylmalonyl-CoA mutase cobalamin-binding domain/chain